MKSHFSLRLYFDFILFQAIGDLTANMTTTLVRRVLIVFVRLWNIIHVDIECCYIYTRFMTLVRNSITTPNL